mmetsp:Transcript_5910/g.18818  ORF Transcript_5910/g.18818 Transcript_5910/m.18818 type:complete len:250 (+) Transcript_5910:3302-4051(+)
MWNCRSQERSFSRSNTGWQLSASSHKKPVGQSPTYETTAVTSIWVICPTFCSMVMRDTASSTSSSIFRAGGGGGGQGGGGLGDGGGGGGGGFGGGGGGGGDSCGEGGGGGGRAGKFVCACVSTRDHVVEYLPLVARQKQPEARRCRHTHQSQREKRKLRKRQLHAPPEVLGGGDAGPGLDPLVAPENAFPGRFVLLVEAGGTCVPIAELAPVHLGRRCAAQVAFVLGHVGHKVERVRMELWSEVTDLGR